MRGEYRKALPKASGFREAMSFFRPGLRDLAAFIWPAHCLNCEAMLGEGAGLCGPCWQAVAWCHGFCCYSCGAPVPAGPPDEDDEDIRCVDCTENPPLWRHARAVFRYEGIGRKLVLNLKSLGRADLVAKAGGWMAHYAADILGEESLIVPVPVHPKRLRQRGFNQAALLARAMSRHNLPGEYAPTLLLRHEYGPKLAHISAAEARYIALKDGFGVRPADRHRLQGKHVLLVDDVLTSGATLDACTRALLGAGALCVDAVVLARHCQAFERRPLG